MWKSRFPRRTLLGSWLNKSSATNTNLIIFFAENVPNARGARAVSDDTINSSSKNTRLAQREKEPSHEETLCFPAAPRPAPRGHKEES